MAQVQYGEGVPTETPDATPPDDYSRVQASPNAFGSQVAQGAEKIGQTGTDLLKFYGQVAANDGGNAYLSTATDIRSKLHSLSGKDAIEYSHVAQQQLEDAYQQNLDNMPTAVSKEQYIENTRRLHSSIMGDVADYGATQTKVYAKNTNDESITSARGLAVTADASGNQNDLTHAKELFRNAYVKNAQLEYGTSDATAAATAVNRADADFYKSRIRAAIPTNPQLAQKLLDEGRNVLASDPEYDRLSASVKTGVADSEIAPAADYFVGQAKTTAAQSVAPPGVGRAATNLANNNPGNLKVPGSATQFQTFPTREAGIAAVDNQIGLYVHRGENTISKIVSTYAPSSENPTDQYINFVAQKTGINPNVPISTTDIPKIRDAMLQFEQGTGKGGTPQQQGQKYTTVTDAMQSNYGKTMSDAEQYAKTKWPLYPDIQERFLSKTQRGLDLAISQQNRDVEVASHTVQAAMTGVMTSGHPPTNEQELESISPQVKAAWATMQFNDPWKATGVQRIFDANARGKALGYGTQFNSVLLDRVLAPAGTQGLVKDPSDLWGYVDPQSGERSPLTNTGLSALSGIIAQRGTPQGEQQAAQLRSFFQKARTSLSQQDPASGIYDPKGEARMTQFVASALPFIKAEEQAGKPLSEILKPKGDLENMVHTYDRTMQERMKDRIFDGSGVAVGDQSPQAVQAKQVGALRSAYAAAKTDEQRQQVIQDAQRQGFQWVPKKGASPAPAPTQAKPQQTPLPVESYEKP